MKITAILFSGDSHPTFRQIIEIPNALSGIHDWSIYAQQVWEVSNDPLRLDEWAYLCNFDSRGLETGDIVQIEHKDRIEFFVTLGTGWHRVTDRYWGQQLIQIMEAFSSREFRFHFAERLEQLQHAS